MRKSKSPVIVFYWDVYTADLIERQVVYEYVPKKGEIPILTFNMNDGTVIIHVLKRFEGF